MMSMNVAAGMIPIPAAMHSDLALGLVIGVLAAAPVLLFIVRLERRRRAGKPEPRRLTPQEHDQLQRKIWRATPWGF